MSAVLTDPEIPVNLNALGLTPQERAALGVQTDPQATVREFRQRDAQDQKWLENAELQRIKAENDEMRRQLGDTSSELQQVRSGYDQMSGQLTAMQLQQQAAAQNAQINREFELTQEEIDNHGEILPIVNKLVGKTQRQIEQEVERRLADEKIKWQAEATRPLQEQLAQTQQMVQQQSQLSKQAFETELVQQIANMGFGDINHLTTMPEFQARYQQPVAPEAGIMTAWGDTLKHHIETQNLNAATQMLRHFRDQHTNLARRDDDEVLPARSGNSAPLSSQQSERLRQREQLTAIYQKRMEEANSGRLPAGWDRAKYRAEQMKLKAQIDSII